ncbi:30S ribosomal protein S14 [Candidatus Woesearchaeota archaeon]|nr:30S ribosomal protein S14 [Candidatus Woesearchaeota archaeon]
MTTSSYKKAYTQLKVKQTKWRKFIKHNAPKKRTTGAALKKCTRCGRTHAHIQKYGLNLCRTCFRECAPSLGFKKYS